MKKIKSKGFTLIELIIAISILAILVAIAVPTYLNMYENSKTNIISIYNDDSQVVCYYNDEIIYVGSAKDIPSYIKEQYELYDIIYKDGISYLYFRDKLLSISE